MGWCGDPERHEVRTDGCGGRRPRRGFRGRRRRGGRLLAHGCGRGLRPHPCFGDGRGGHRRRRRGARGRRGGKGGFRAVGSGNRGNQDRNDKSDDDRQPDLSRARPPAALSQRGRTIAERSTRHAGSVTQNTQLSVDGAIPVRRGRAAQVLTATASLPSPSLRAHYRSNARRSPCPVHARWETVRQSGIGREANRT